MSGRTTKRTTIGDRIAVWHGWLRGTAPESEGGEARKGNAAALAELRRCSDTREVMLTWPFGRLVRMAFLRVADGGIEAVGGDIAALARTALIMSRVRRAGAEPPTLGRVPRLMAQVAEGSRMPAVGRVRANVLFSSPDADEACRSLLSILPLLGGGEPTLNAGHVHRAMRRWDNAKTDWAMDYYAALPLNEKTAAD